jgi:hypothetical protein
MMKNKQKRIGVDKRDIPERRITPALIKRKMF